MPPVKRAPTPGKKAGRAKAASNTASKAATLPLRKSSQLRRVSPAVIDLGELNNHLGYFVRRIQVWIFQDFIRRLARIDISPAQFSVLVIIGANEGLSQSELAGTLGIERARLVRMLHLLDRRGLTERLPSTADGRRHALRLTRAGQAHLKQAKALAAQHEVNLLPKLGAERYRMLLDALREV
ncbi:MAG: MarR family transcriptional regulator [Pseudolabrys sp.]|nr:MarR family transcriptional regulator [Pseudolabrys sp.]MDP2297357.1 MarR family transcriptional regulator [Pseudolabrys sp.]